MPAPDVVDLCSDGSDSDADLPPLASLTARLQQRRMGGASAAATAAAVTAAAAAARPPPRPGSGARAPLLALQNQVAGSQPGKQRGENFEPGSPSRPQHHQQEQRGQGQQPLARAATPTLPASGARRGKRSPADLGTSLPRGPQRLLPFGAEDDEEWRPGDSPAGQPAKKQRRAKRSTEEIEAEKAFKVRCRSWCPPAGARAPAWLRSTSQDNAGAGRA